MPTATTLSDHGFDVHGVDTNEKVVLKLSSGKVHIIEKNLDELFIKVTESKSLTFSSTPSESDVFIITVPTPLHSDNSPNTDYIFEAQKYCTFCEKQQFDYFRVNISCWYNRKT